VLDNFKHVLDAAPLVAELLAATTRLRVLVTSREPLHVRAERLFRLEPLALPAVAGNGDGAGAEATPAVELFLAVARTQGRASRSARRTHRRSRASAAASTGSRSQSSLRPPGSDCSRRPSWRNGSTRAWTRSARDRATRPPASAR